jgi:hypothetical protein
MLGAFTPFLLLLYYAIGVAPLGLLHVYNFLFRFFFRAFHPLVF